MTTEIDGEVAYPIYSISARWVNDGEHDPKYPRRYEGLPDGRVSNSTGFNWMYPYETELGWVEKAGMRWWEKYRRRDKGDKYSIHDKHPDGCILSVKYVRHEVWCLTWFEHYTFDRGQTDEEVLRSFRTYVRRVEDFNYKHGWHDSCTDFSIPHIALMGAEDRWRWCGGEDPHHPTHPPCRCGHCQRRGVIRIGH